ncbi:MAG: sugar-binding domain-containing protein [Desulfobacterales bacterium]|jgi:deoxyribonucleoside regulator
MNNHAEILKLVEISRLYYERNLTQADIAKRMNISRPAVSKLLSEARIRGIVRIEIKSPLMSDDSLLKELSDAYNLKGGLVVPSGSANGKLITQLLIAQASLYFEKFLLGMNKVGLGWGDTMGRLVDGLKNISSSIKKTGYVCPVIGSAPNDIKWYQTNEIARVFTEKTGFVPYYLHAPAFPVSLKNKKLFENTLEYQEISKCWQELDIVILGIGTYPSVPDQATAARFGDLLRKKKAVGMIATYYFDVEGNIIKSKDDIVIRIPLDDLHCVDKVFVIGGGEKKINSIRGTLKTGLVSHLITDDRTAEALVRFA